MGGPPMFLATGCLPGMVLQVLLANGWPALVSEHRVGEGGAAKSYLFTRYFGMRQRRRGVEGGGGQQIGKMCQNSVHSLQESLFKA